MRLVYMKTSGEELDTAYCREMLEMMRADGVLDGIEVDFDAGPDAPVVQSREAMRRYECGILNRVRRHVEEARHDAIVLQSILDPALYPAREISPVPVLGCAESAAHLASMLGHRFSFLCTVPVELKLIPENLAVYGLAHKLASMRCIRLSVPEVKERGDREGILCAMEAEAVAAIEEDGADVVILGCTGLSWMAPDLRARLVRYEHEVPVIQPVWAAVSFARMLVSLGLRHSGRTYPPPPAVVEAASPPAATA